MSGRRAILAGAVAVLGVPMPVLPSTTAPCPAAAMLPTFLQGIASGDGPDAAVEEAISWVAARSTLGALMQVMVARADAVCLHSTGSTEESDGDLMHRIDRLLWSAMPILAAGVAAPVPAALMDFYHCPWVHPMEQG